MYGLARRVVLIFEQCAGHIVTYYTIESASFHVRGREITAFGNLQHVEFHVVVIGGNDIDCRIGAFVTDSALMPESTVVNMVTVAGVP